MKLDLRLRIHAVITSYRTSDSLSVLHIPLCIICPDFHPAMHLSAQYIVLLIFINYIGS